MAPHSSTRAWKIPWIEEPGGLQSMDQILLSSCSCLLFLLLLTVCGAGSSLADGLEL